MDTPTVTSHDVFCITGPPPGVHNAKAEECTTPRIGSRNIEIKIGGGGLPRNSNLCCYSCRVPAVLSASPSL